MPPRPIPTVGTQPLADPGRVVARFAKTHPSRGSLRNFAKTTSAATCACPSPGRAPARAEPGGRVVAQFRKNHVRRDLCPSFRRVVPSPVPNPARGACPAGARVVAQFREKHPRPCNRRLLAAASPQVGRSPLWDRTTADAEIRRCRRSARSAILPFRAPIASGRNRNRKYRKRRMPWRHRAGTSPQPARMIGVHRRSSAARSLSE